MVECPWTNPSPEMNGIISYRDVSADINEPFFKEMAETAKKAGFRLHVHFPRLVADTGECVTDGGMGIKFSSFKTRKSPWVNAYIEKAPDGKYRLSNRYTLTF